MGGGYGYAGEWTDASGLQYLRARYYSPVQGRFLTKDPFPGFLSQPATLNPYAYVANNPVLMSDPSGMIAPFLAAALVGGSLSAAIDIGVQLYNMQPASLGQAIRCLNWGKVGVSFAAGAVAGIVGLSVGLAGAAIAGTGLLATIATGAASGAISGQIARAITNIFNGNEITAGLGNANDMLLDGFIGGILSGVGYGVGKVRQSNTSVKPPLIKPDSMGRFPSGSQASQLGHIFRDAPGHFANDTAANRALIIETVTRDNYIMTDKFGNQVFSRMLNDGTEVWAFVRNDIIWDAGLNQTARWNK